MSDQRAWRVSKTRQGTPKLTLYEGGRVLVARPMATVVVANRMGALWAESSPGSSSG